MPLVPKVDPKDESDLFSNTIQTVHVDEVHAKFVAALLRLLVQELYGRHKATHG